MSAPTELEIRLVRHWDRDDSATSRNIMREFCQAKPLKMFELHKNLQA